MEHDSEKMRQAAGNSPVAWFVMLERARRANDYAMAIKATRELNRLGVEVKYSGGRKGAGNE